MDLVMDRDPAIPKVPRLSDSSVKMIQIIHFPCARPTKVDGGYRIQNTEYRMHVTGITFK